MRVKICGLTRAADAAAAAALGADYLGVILSPGFGRSVEPTEASRFRFPGGPLLVGVVVDLPPAELVERARTAGVDVLQLHGSEPPDALRALREEGSWTLWKAVRVRSGDDVREAVELYRGVADGLLLEGWHPGRGGGVGASFPADEVAAVRSAFPPGLDLVVAGGLRPETVAEVVRTLRPQVVDVSSGVESAPGVKDPRKVEAFVGNARREAGSIT